MHFATIPASILLAPRSFALSRGLDTFVLSLTSCLRAGWPGPPSYMSYTPDESAAQLFAEQAWLAGALITGTGYGIVMALFWLCFRALWNRLKCKDPSRGRNLFFLLYVCAQFVFGSLFLASNSKFTQLAFINYRGFPGGPSAYEQQMFSIGVDEIGNVSYVLANWLADSLLVWPLVGVRFPKSC